MHIQQTVHAFWRNKRIREEVVEFNRQEQTYLVELITTLKIILLIDIMKILINERTSVNNTKVIPNLKTHNIVRSQWEHQILKSPNEYHKSEIILERHVFLFIFWVSLPPMIINETISYITVCSTKIKL